MTRTEPRPAEAAILGASIETYAAGRYCTCCGDAIAECSCGFRKWPAPSAQGYRYTSDTGGFGWAAWTIEGAAALAMEPEDWRALAELLLGGESRGAPGCSFGERPAVHIGRHRVVATRYSGLDV